MKQFQHQARPTYPFTAATTPPPVVGMAWFVQHVDPLFPPAVKSYLQPDNATIKTVIGVPPAGNIGQPFAFPFNEPRFENKFRVELQQTNMHTLEDPANFPPPTLVGGVDWWYSWDQPNQVKVPASLMPTEFKALVPATLPVAISGSAFNRYWESPYFPTTVKPWLQTVGNKVPNALFLPIISSGIPWWIPFDQPAQVKFPSLLQLTHTWKVTPESAIVPWWRPFDQPQQVKVPSQLQQTELAQLFFPLFNPPVSGLSWWYPFDQPKQVKVPVELQPAEMKGILLASTLPPRPVLVGRRLPLFTAPTSATGNVGAVYPSNFWKGQTS